MKANLSLQFSTSWGKPLKPQPSAGSLVAAVDYDGTTARQIHIDTSKDGQPTEKLHHSRVRIYDRQGLPVFSGTYDEMIDKLTNKK